MNLEFDVDDTQKLTRTDSTTEVVSKNYNVYRCRFTFSDEWLDINKFVIFRDGWGETTTVHIGKGSRILCCMVPNQVLDGTHFKVMVYGGDLLSTNNVSIPLVTSGYMNGLSDPTCTRKQKDIFIEIFNELDAKIDGIIYDNHCLNLFCKDTLVESVYLPFADEDTVTDLITSTSQELLEIKNRLDTVEEIAERMVVDDEVDPDSPNAISSKAVYEALETKEDKYDFSSRLDELIQNLITHNGE